MRIQARRIARTTAILVLLAGSALVATLGHATWQAQSAPSTPLDDSTEAEDLVGDLGLPAEVELRRLEVLSELAKLRGHAWAGEYFHGDGEGMNVSLVLAPEAGAATWWRGCLGLYAAEQAEVSARADGVLELDLPTADEHDFARFPARLQPVHWGERRYLVEPAKLIDFVNAVNAGYEPRSQRFGLFLLADGDQDKPASGLPDLPAEYLALVRNESLKVHVLAIERLPETEFAAGLEAMPGFPETAMPAAAAWCDRKYLLTLDQGSAAGLVAGVELRCADTCGYETARVVGGDAQRATAEVGIYEHCEDRTTPDRDWVFETGAYVPGR